VEDVLGEAAEALALELLAAVEDELRALHRAGSDRDRGFSVDGRIQPDYLRGQSSAKTGFV
jgi:hypothetical protein